MHVFTFWLHTFTYVTCCRLQHRSLSSDVFSFSRISAQPDARVPGKWPPRGGHSENIQLLLLLDRDDSVTFSRQYYSVGHMWWEHYNIMCTTSTVELLQLKVPPFSPISLIQSTLTDFNYRTDDPEGWAWDGLGSQSSRLCNVTLYCYCLYML